MIVIVVLLFIHSSIVATELLVIVKNNLAINMPEKIMCDYYSYQINKGSFTCFDSAVYNDYIKYIMIEIPIILLLITIFDFISNENIQKEFRRYHYKDTLYIFIGLNFFIASCLRGIVFLTGHASFIYLLYTIILLLMSLALYFFSNKKEFLKDFKRIKNIKFLMLCMLLVCFAYFTHTSGKKYLRYTDLFFPIIYFIFTIKYFFSSNIKDSFKISSIENLSKEELFDKKSKLIKPNGKNVIVLIIVALLAYYLVFFKNIKIGNISEGFLILVTIIFSILSILYLLKYIFLLIRYYIILRSIKSRLNR